MTFYLKTVVSASSGMPFPPGTDPSYFDGVWCNVVQCPCGSVRVDRGLYKLRCRNIGKFVNSLHLCYSEETPGNYVKGRHFQDTFKNKRISVT